MLEKKEKVLLKKVAAEVEKAKEFTRGKNKRGRLLNSWVLVLENIFRVLFFFSPIFTYIVICNLSFVLCSGNTMSEEEEVI